MSIDRHHYVIAGYDLTDLKTEKYEDWKWTDEGEQFLCNQVKDRVQLFDDPMCSSHLYLGHILAAGDEYYFETVKFNMIDVIDAFDDVTYALTELQRAGAISLKDKSVPTFQIIVFEECR